ncbi:MAG: hypothetical protein H7Y22_14410, partial [Gemmatimonadaceae bacterium]|nr:hypothetical protein [Gloeobacterales cyanobacterium ES-bin-141]
MSFREHHFSAQYTQIDPRNQDICKLATAQIIRYVRNLLKRQGGSHCLALAEDEFLQCVYIAAWRALEENPQLSEEPPREIALVLKRRLTTLVDRHGPDKLGLGQRNRPERFFRTMRAIDEKLHLAANPDEASYGHLV